MVCGGSRIIELSKKHEESRGGSVAISLHVHTCTPFPSLPMAWTVIDGTTEVVQMSQTITCTCMYVHACGMCSIK